MNGVRNTTPTVRPTVISTTISPATLDGTIPVSRAVSIPKAISLPGGLQQLSRPTPPPSPSTWVHVDTKSIQHSVSPPISVHSGIESSTKGGLSEKDRKSSVGSNKDVNRTVTASNGVSGQSGGIQSGGGTKTSTVVKLDAVKFQQYCVDQIKKDGVSGWLAKQDDETKTRLLLSINPSKMNEYVKVFRFASDDQNNVTATVFPWNLATWRGQIWTPLGINNTAATMLLANGVGWYATGVAAGAGVTHQTNDISVDLDAIPLDTGTSVLYNGMPRSGPAIHIHSVHGHFKVQRNPLVDLANGTPAAATAEMPYRPPHVISYLQRVPINLTATDNPNTQLYNSGPTAVAGFCTYPIPQAVGAGAPGADQCDFLQLQAGASAIANPHPLATAVWLPNTLLDNVDREYKRSPMVATEIMSVHQSVRHADCKIFQPLHAVNTGEPAATTGAVWTQSYVATTSKTYTIEHNHHFKKPLHVVYANQDPTRVWSVSAFNQLRAKYWQDTTGLLLVTNAAGTTPTNAYHSCYQELASYEFFVTFSDAPLQED